MLLRRFLLTFVLMMAAAIPAFARPTSFAPAQTTFQDVLMPKGEVVSEDKPVLLTADAIDYQQKENVVTATGKVEIVQGDTLVLADKLIYDRARDVVIVRGNVSVMDQAGNVVFADEAELRDQMREGVIAQFKMRLNDDSLFAAASAQRVNEDVLVLENALVAR